MGIITGYNAVYTYTAIKNELGATNEIPNNWAVGATFKGLDMPEVEIIGKDAFKNCKNLENMTFANCFVIKDYAFASSLSTTANFPRVTTIGKGAFESSRIQTFNVGAALTKLEDEAFAYCYYLKNIYLDAVTYFGKSCLIYCEYVSITLNPNTTVIDDQALAGVKNVYGSMPPNIQKIGASAFADKKNISLTYVPNSVTYIGEYAFENSSFSGTTLPANITSLPVGCFQACLNITNMNLPYVTYYGGNCFWGCSNLHSLVLGSVGRPVTFIQNATSYGIIYAGAFQDCPNLTNITIYTNGGAALPNAPWGATNAVINYVPA